MITPKVKFTTLPELYGVIPEPLPAKKVIPEWYKRLPNFTSEDEHRTQWPMRTVKRCPPVFDSMAAGWILRTPADIDIRISSNGEGVSWRSDFSLETIQPHESAQIAGHPKDRLPPLKFLNYWHMQTPPGWSTLFVNPLNRQHTIIDAVPGIVETDKYFEFVNFPSFLVPQKDKTFTIPRGFPIVQAIPFKRGCTGASIKPMGPKELTKLEKTRAQRQSHPSLYRDTMWEKNK